MIVRYYADIEKMRLDSIDGVVMVLVPDKKRIFELIGVDYIECDGTDDFMGICQAELEARNLA